MDSQLGSARRRPSKRVSNNSNKPLDLRSGLRFVPVGLHGARVHRTIPRLPAIGVAAISRKSGPRSVRRRERRLPAAAFAIRRRAAATVGDRMASNPIKTAQFPVSRTPPTSPRFGSTPTSLPGRAPILCGSTMSRASRHRLSSSSRTA